MSVMISNTREKLEDRYLALLSADKRPTYQSRSRSSGWCGYLSGVPSSS